jgi:ribonuclease HII
MAKRAPKAPKKRPTYREEASLLAEGYGLVAGVDEVGRGPVAGPVLAGAVILPPRPRGSWVKLVRDSKQMTPKQRDVAFHEIRKAAVCWEVGVSSPSEIDRLGIAPATRLAMMRALDSLAMRPDFVLLDAFPLPDLALPQKAIVRGDSLCLSIAAASIMAKVTRDQIMRREDAWYPGYGFAEHKGYCTRRHMRNLQELGPCPIHRTSFSPIKEMAAAG